MDYLKFVPIVAEADVRSIQAGAAAYGDSWMKRGGVGAFMVSIRKVDRMENQVAKHGYDVFKAIREDQRPEGIIDDIRDYRHYLMMIEAYAMAEGFAPKLLGKYAEAVEDAETTDSETVELPWASGGIIAIAKERARQQNEKGWTPDHDDSLSESALIDKVFGRIDKVAFSDMDHVQREKMLVEAGALIAAELERMYRQCDDGCEEEEDQPTASQLHPG